MFTKGDVGKKIVLEVLIESLSEDCEIHDDMLIPTNAIISFEYLVLDISKYLPIIRVKDKPLDILNPIKIAKRLGADSVVLNGYYIKDVENDFVIIYK